MGWTVPRYFVQEILGVSSVFTVVSALEMITVFTALPGN